MQEAWLRLLEALRQRIDPDRLDPLDARRASWMRIPQLERSLDAKEPPERDQLGARSYGSASAAGVSGFG